LRISQYEKTCPKHNFGNNRRGSIYTVDANQPWTDAVAITAERITFVGSNDDLDEQDTDFIEIGKLADLVVVDQNLFEIDPSEISDTRALLTLMGGKAVYAGLDEL